MDSRLETSPKRVKLESPSEDIVSGHVQPPNVQDIKCEPDDAVSGLQDGPLMDPPTATDPATTDSAPNDTDSISNVEASASSVTASNVSSSVTSSNVTASSVTASNTTASNITASNTTASNITASNTTASNIPASNIPASNIPASNIPASNIPASNIPASNIPASNIPASNIPAISTGSSTTKLDPPTDTKSALNSTTSQDTQPHLQTSKLIDTEILASKLGLSRASKEERLFLFNVLTPETSSYLASVSGPITKMKISQLSTGQFGSYHTITFSILYDADFSHNLQLLTSFLDSATVHSAKDISYHIVWTKKWADTPDSDKAKYQDFLHCLEKKAGDKVVHCALINKYDASTIYITAKDDLVQLGKDMQSDIDKWPRLRILDYSRNSIRLVPGVKFPDSLQVLNLGGGEALETLSGFKMPTSLQKLDVSHNLISSIDYVTFPSALKSLDLSYNRIYFLNYVDFPANLKRLDISENCIDNLKNVNFPRGLTFLSISRNPIECIKGVRFPESLKFLDVSCIPNESMTGIKFPDNTDSLNLQSSMTNTRGLKLPPFVKHLNLAANGVNSINPLKLPNSIEHLFLANNNIKTLSKVSFPSSLKELYLGNNMVTTLKNVQFPATLEVLDMEMDPHIEDNEKYITSLKEVIFPDRLRVLRLGYHMIKTIESLEFPPLLEDLCIQYNDLRVFRNIKFGPHLISLDLSGNVDLGSLDNVYFPRTLRTLRIPSGLVDNLPAVIVERANKKDLIIEQSMPH